jgi:hypothetical protein
MSYYMIYMGYDLIYIYNMYKLVRVVGYEWDNSVDILYVVIAVILQQMEYQKITSKHSCF